jgi:hypothetical protein
MHAEKAAKVAKAAKEIAGEITRINHSKDTINKAALQPTQRHLDTLGKPRKIIPIDKLAALTNLPHNEFSKDYPFRSPERGTGHLLQRFPRQGTDGPCYFLRCPKIIFHTGRFNTPLDLQSKQISPIDKIAALFKGTSKNYLSAISLM